MQEQIPFKSKWYSVYKYGSLAVVLPIIFIILSMILASTRNSFIDIFLPLLQVISQIAVFGCVMYSSIKIINHSRKNKIYSWSYYLSIIGIICMLLMIGIGIWSAFLISDNTPIYNGVNLTWSSILLISSIIMFFIHKKDIDNGIVEISSNNINNEYKDNYNYYQPMNYGYNKSEHQYNQNKTLTPKDYKLLIIFSSLCFVTIFAYALYFIIYYSLFNIYDLMNIFSYVNGLLIPNWKLGLLVLISSFIFLPYFIATIGSFIMSKKIRKKAKLIENNKKNFINIVYYLSIVNFVIFLITLLTGFVLIGISNLNPNSFIAIIVMIAISLIILIVIFVFSLKARKFANDNNYFDNSSITNNF